jgi:hypothetical protein
VGGGKTLEELELNVLLIRNGDIYRYPKPSQDCGVCQEPCCIITMETDLFDTRQGYYYAYVK